MGSNLIKQSAIFGSVERVRAYLYRSIAVVGYLYFDALSAFVEDDSIAFHGDCAGKLFGCIFGHFCHGEEVVGGYRQK